MQSLNSEEHCHSPLRPLATHWLGAQSYPAFPVLMCLCQQGTCGLLWWWKQSQRSPQLKGTFAPLHWGCIDAGMLDRILPLVRFLRNCPWDGGFFLKMLSSCLTLFLWLQLNLLVLILAYRQMKGKEGDMESLLPTGPLLTCCHRYICLSSGSPPVFLPLHYLLFLLLSPFNLSKKNLLTIFCSLSRCHWGSWEMAHLWVTGLTSWRPIVCNLGNVQTLHKHSRISLCWLKSGTWPFKSK